MRIPFPHNFPAELRLIEEADAEKLFALINRNRQHLRRWLPWLDGNMSINDTHAFVRLSQEQYSSKKGFQTVICFKNELAGAIGYHPIDWQNRTVMIGYWLGEDFQGKGIMTEACRVLVNYAFNEFKLNRVEIKCATGNTKSCAIPERLQFIKEGVIKEGEWLYDHFVDLVLYRMLAHEWKNIQEKKPPPIVV
jgi:ribosomal-protein-serine acetyltransferase